MATRDDSNRKRALAEVLSLDAWHREFSKKRKSAPLFVDVAFKEGRIGGEPESQVAFRLRLKRAEIVVVVPVGEPAKIERRGVSRDAPRSRAKRTIEDKRRHKTGKKANVGAGGGGPFAKIELGSERTTATSTTTSETVPAMLVLHSLNEDGDHSWEVRPAFGEGLWGRPWDAERDPRLTVLDTRRDRDKGIPAGVRVEIRCRREDLDVQEIRLKERDLWKQLSGKRGARNRLAAAEAAIRNRLLEIGFAHGDISDPFVRLTLASVTAETSPND